ncbi:MAG TPA: tetratricopeptide repeat protein, partial [Pyrinomonadaceae bacterium]|nr:tetratricopeptide repeat protein [Pyrinomonadaceae bacterium]
MPPTDPRIAISLNHLGDLYIVKGDNEAARQIFERLLQLQAELTAPDHISLAPTMERLAIIYYRQEAKSKSDDYYQRALALRERAFGAESLSVAQSRSAMAQFYRGEKDFDRAARSYRRSISIYGKTSGVDSPEFERAMDGFTCLAYESKQPNAIREVEMTRALFAPHRPTVLVENAILNGRAISLPRPEYPADARI